MVDGDEYESDPAVIDPEQRPDDACAYGREFATKTWTCPRDPREEGDYCIFHAPVAEKRAKAVREAFVSALDRPGREAKCFMGARLESLDLSYETIRPPDNYPIDLRYATVEGELNCEHATVESPVRLVDAEIGTCTFDLATFRDDVVLTEASVHELSASRAEFSRAVTGKWLSVAGDLSVDRGRFQEDVELEEATVEGDMDVSNATIRGRLWCWSIDVWGDVDGDGLDCEDTVSLTNGSIDGELELSNAFVADGVVLHNATVGGELRMNDVAVEDTVAMTHCVVEGTLDLSQAEFGDTLLAASAELGAVEGVNPTFDGAVYANGTEVRDSTELSSVTAVETFDCRLATLGETAELHGTFDDIRLVETTLVDGGVVDLARAEVRSGEISLPSEDAVVYDFTDATLGDVALEAIDDETLLFEHFQFENTTFDGFDFAPYKDELAAVDWRIDTVTDAVDLEEPEEDIEEAFPDPDQFRDLDSDTTDRLAEIYAVLEDSMPFDLDTDLDDLETEEDFREFFDEMAEKVEELEEESGDPTPGELENTYLKAKNGAAQTDADEIAAAFFIREMKLRRRRHAREFREADTLAGGLRSAWNWGTNLTLDVVAGYGERPRNVVGVSVGLIGVFAVVYQLMNGLQSGSGAVDYLLFSLQNFVAFLIGNNPRGSLPVQYASATEAFLGAFLIALFVFTLTRSLNR
jgi:hypothetical protein